VGESLRAALAGMNPLLVDGAYELDLDELPALPFSGATHVPHPGLRGYLKVEKWPDGLYLNCRKAELYWSPDQLGDKCIQGHKLREELEARGGNVPARLLDFLEEHPEFWPEDWKVDAEGNPLNLFAWADLFRNADGNLCVRYAYWHEGRVVVDYGWLDLGWGRQNPAASCASASPLATQP